MAIDLNEIVRVEPATHAGAARWSLAHAHFHGPDAVETAWRRDRSALEQPGFVQPPLRRAQLGATKQVAGLEAERVPDGSFGDVLVAGDDDLADPHAHAWVHGQRHVREACRRVDRGGRVDS